MTVSGALCSASVAAGQGVPHDLIHAYMWFSHAASSLSPGEELNSVSASLAAIAENLTSDDIGRAIGMVAYDTSSYYVIGYQPDNAVMDGKFRSIDVKTRAAGLKIRARKGYAATNLPPQEFVRRALGFGYGRH